MERIKVDVGDAAWCLAKQAIDEKWNDAKLGPAIAQFAIKYREESQREPYPQDEVLYERNGSREHWPGV